MSRFYNEYHSKEMLRHAGFPVGAYVLAKSEKEAITAAARFGGELAMKIVSDQIVHKTEAKGVFLNVRGETEVKETYQKLLKNAKEFDASAVVEGVLITPMFPKGVEVIVGALRDVQFGPVIMFGLGGVFVEIFKDVKFRMAPLNIDEATRLIRSVKAFPLLDGARGAQKVNLTALADVVVQLSNYIVEHENVREIDLNPVLCYDNEVVVIDASIGEEK